MATVPINRRRAFTLLEAVIALAVIEVAMLAITYTLTAGAKQADAGRDIGLATILCEDLMEEVRSFEYADLDNPTNVGPEPSENSRSDFDDIDDFDGFEEDAGSLAFPSGTAYADSYQGFARAVSVTDSSESIADISETVTGRRITVTVTTPDGLTFQMTRFVANPSQGGGS